MMERTRRREVLEVGMSREGVLCRSEWSVGVDRVAGVWLECRSEWSVGVDRVAGLSIRVECRC